MDIANKENIVNLIYKKNIGCINDEELKQLNEWREKHALNERTYQRLSDAYILGNLFKTAENINITESFEEYKNICVVVERRKKLRMVSRISAIVIIIIGISGLVRYSTNLNNEKIVIKESSVIQRAKNNSVKLFMADGGKIDLSSRIDSSLTKKANIEISTDSTVQFINKNNIAKTEINKIVVPKGGEYNFYLSDGTHVYLNSESIIEFPVSFTGNTRTIKLEGEAYFNVVKNTAKPFIVKTKLVNVEVTGTKFNIKSYSSDANVQATLVEGSVNVCYGNNKKVSIIPGEQAELNMSDNDIIIRKVNPKRYIAWMSFEFYFENETLENIMNVLCRWYDLEVFYQNREAKKLRYSGKFSKETDMNRLLKAFKKIKDVNYTMKGKTVIFK